MGLFILGIIIFVTGNGLFKVCENVLSTIRYPAYDKGVYTRETGERYYLGYDEEGRFSIFSYDMELIFSSDDVELAIPEGNIVRIRFKDGTESVVDIDTKEVGCGVTML